VRVIALRTLRMFWETHPRGRRAEEPLKAWHAEATRATWTGPADVKAKYRSASILKGGRVVFNIAGNEYRLVVHIHYAKQIVFVRFVGTHEEYDAIDAQTV
jgi:mRNA interferase HigB